MESTLFSECEIVVSGLPMLPPGRGQRNLLTALRNMVIGGGGTVTDMTMPIDPGSSESLGYACFTLISRTQARAAVRLLNGYKYDKFHVFEAHTQGVVLGSSHGACDVFATCPMALATSCPICEDECSLKTIALEPTAACQHAICSSCYVIWKESGNTSRCPVCHTPIPSNVSAADEIHADAGGASRNGEAWVQVAVDAPTMGTVVSAAAQEAELNARLELLDPAVRDQLLARARLAASAEESPTAVAEMPGTTCAEATHGAAQEDMPPATAAKDKLWEEMTEAECEAARSLGFDCTLWNNGISTDACYVAWAQLAPPLLAAATLLGYAEDIWDGELAVLLSLEREQRERLEGQQEALEAQDQEAQGQETQAPEAREQHTQEQTEKEHVVEDAQEPAQGAASPSATAAAAAAATSSAATSSAAPSTASELMIDAAAGLLVGSANSCKLSQLVQHLGQHSEAEAIKAVIKAAGGAKHFFRKAPASRYFTIELLLGDAPGNEIVELTTHGLERALETTHRSPPPPKASPPVQPPTQHRQSPTQPSSLPQQLPLPPPPELLPAAAREELLFRQQIFEFLSEVGRVPLGQLPSRMAKHFARTDTAITGGPQGPKTVGKMRTFVDRCPELELVPWEVRAMREPSATCGC